MTWLAGIGAALAALAGAVLYGWRKRGQAEAGRADRDHIEVRKRIDAENYVDSDIAASRERMRKRGEQ